MHGRKRHGTNMSMSMNAFIIVVVSLLSKLKYRGQVYCTRKHKRGALSADRYWYAGKS